MVRLYFRSARDRQLKQLKRHRAGNWVYSEAPTVAEVEQLCAKYRLDAAIVADAQDMDEMPRLEFESGVSYLFTRFATGDSTNPQTAPVLIAVTSGAVLTICPKPLPALEKLVAGQEVITTQKTKLLLILLGEVISSYQSYLKAMARRIRSTRSSLRVERIDNKVFIQFVGFEDALNDFLSALVPTHSLLNSLSSGKHLALFEQDVDLVEDLSQNSRQLIESCKAHLKTIVNIREAYSTIMTNNLNRTIKLLTALTIILTIPTIISSIFGMNVSLPFAANPYSFYYLIAFTAGLSAGLLWLFNRNDWL